VNVVPPGESGLDTLPSFTAATTGVAPTYGPHTQDQLPLYTGWTYKSMQFQGQGEGSPAPGDPNVLIYRDPSYGVPTITASSEADLYYGIGYAMAQDRLFQMEVFRHVGHGTLAQLIGPSGLPMDMAVHRASEGTALLDAEFSRLPSAYRIGLQRFTDGINAYIRQAETDVTKLPAEFLLLNDYPIASWTVGDSLGFGEYAARFFGEFGGSELGAAVTYLDLVNEYGQPHAETIFEDLLPLDDPRAPTSIAAQDGIFPRHVGRPVPSAFTGSRYANHDPSTLPPLADVAPIERRVDLAAAQVTLLQRLLAIPRWGSNAVIVSGRLTKDHAPMLYGGPQTGWAVPGFLWEAEVHDPVRDERGIMVPGIPLFVIGRNADAAWTVTSAEDANSDLYVEQLDASNTHYLHDGRWLPIQEQTVTLGCTNPPTDVTGLLTGLPNPQVPPLCPLTPTTMHLYRTLHGNAVADPDSDHHLYVHASTVDGRILQSLQAWDLAGQQHDATHFGAAVSNMGLGFNFFYVDDHGTIGYWHTGVYPIEAANADPTLPMPGTGAYDWQGFESWPAHPHVVNPSTGFVVNWNGKPAVGWWSKGLSGREAGFWGDEWESVPLAADVARRAPLSFAELGQVPRDVAYLDNPARVFLPYLRAALAATTDPQLEQVRGYLATWDGRRDFVNGTGGYGSPAVVFFDRWMEHVLARTEAPTLRGDFARNAGLDCSSPPCHYVSVDNLSAPTYKFEDATEQVLVAALRGETHWNWLGTAGGEQHALYQAALDAAAELTSAQGSDVAHWNEPVETGQFQAQGAISVPALDPLPNRGSYGQVIEARPTTASTPSRAAGATGGGTLAATGAGTMPAAGGLALLVLAAFGWRRRRLSAGGGSRRD